MAIMIPKVYSNDEFHESKGEELVYNALKKMSDKYVVFRSLSWKKKVNRRIKEGEADFVFYNPECGLIVIEVKSGGIYTKDGQWFQINRRTQQHIPLTRNPQLQADESKYHLRDVLKKANLNICVNSAVWFTSVYRRDASLPMESIDETIFWKDDLENPGKALQRCYHACGAWTDNPSDDLKRKVIETLAPEFNAIPLGREIKEISEEHFVRMNNEQTRILDFLVEQREAAIMGGAGTGKTILAMEKAKRLASEGKVLLLC